MWPNSQETADLASFTPEILNGKLHFFVQCLGNLRCHNGLLLLIYYHIISRNQNSRQWWWHWWQWMGGGRELNYKFFLFSDLYIYIICYDKDHFHNSVKIFLDLAIRESFFTRKWEGFFFGNFFSIFPPKLSFAKVFVKSFTFLLSCESFYLLKFLLLKYAQRSSPTFTSNMKQDDFRGNRIWLIRLNLLNIKSKNLI